MKVDSRNPQNKGEQNLPLKSRARGAKSFGSVIQGFLNAKTHNQALLSVAVVGGECSRKRYKQDVS